MTRNRLVVGCPVPGCQMLKREDHLLCEAHWEKLPRPLKQRVLNTYARYIAVFRHPTWKPDSPERRALIDAWMSTAKAAINYFTGNRRAA